MTSVGIVGYGVYVPIYRLKIEEIWDTWVGRYPPSSIKQLMGLNEVAFNSWYEDTITMASDSAKAALEMAGVAPTDVGGAYLGTCTNPYVTKASATLVAESLGLRPEILCADCQFSSKSGTSALQICLGLVGAGIIDYGLAIGSDSLNSHVAPNDLPLEYSASSGAAAFLVGNKNTMADIEHTSSFVTDTADFFRLDGDRYIARGFSAEEESVGYDHHVTSAVNGFMKRFGYTTGDFTYAVFHQPNGANWLGVGRKIGFADNQLSPGLIADKIGDCGSACSMIALASVLDKARPDERILVASYGYGAGSDVFSIKTTELIEVARGRRKKFGTTMAQIERKIYIDYRDYLRMQRKLIQEYV